MIMITTISPIRVPSVDPSIANNLSLNKHPQKTTDLGQWKTPKLWPLLMGNDD